MYKRPFFNEVIKRLQEPRKFIQVLAGPRQCGKTTLILQVLEAVGIPSHYASADAVTGRNGTWRRGILQLLHIILNYYPLPI